MTDTMTRLDFRELMTVTTPEGKHGTVEIRRFHVSEEDAKRTRLQAMMHGRGYVEPGTYTELRRNGHLWMTDTNDEKRDHIGFLYAVQRQKSRTVLVNGLGIGMVAHALPHIPTVEHVTICEIDPDVIALVGPHLRYLYAEHGKYLDIIQGDALNPARTFPKGSYWDAAWTDIWQDICGDDYEQHKRARRVYARRTGVHMLWCEDQVRYAHQQSGRWGW